MRADRLEPGYSVNTDDAFLARVFDKGLKAFSPNGILGNPIGASTAIGTTCLDSVAGLIVDHVRSRRV